MSFISAQKLGLCSCDICGFLSKPTAEKAYCPRCGSKLNFRISHSLKWCWAFVIAGYILYIPANVMTMMITSSLISYREDTILSGVIYLWVSGSESIAAIVFIASIVVPLFKLITLTYLLISIQNRSKLHTTEKMKLYRIIDFIGKWSMLDVYVLTLLAAIVQMQSYALVKAGYGSIAFASVLGLFASPKLILTLV